MVLVFDLDDTLYNELSYVESGFRAVATFGEFEFGWCAEKSFKLMKEFLRINGRGMVFDSWLQVHGKHSKGLVNRCVNVYRHHMPDIRVFDCVNGLLANLSDRPLYVVTDGHKLVQAKKIEALKLGGVFRHVYITHRYGIRYEKPSTYCFELILKREGCQWSDLVYVGDNPRKDFVNLNPLGVRTVRVLTGSYKDAHVPDHFDAVYSIPDLTKFNALLEGFD